MNRTSKTTMAILNDEVLLAAGFLITTAILDATSNLGASSMPQPGVGVGGPIGLTVQGVIDAKIGVLNASVNLQQGAIGAFGALAQPGPGTLPQRVIAASDSLYQGVTGATDTLHDNFIKGADSVHQEMETVFRVVLPPPIPQVIDKIHYNLLDSVANSVYAGAKNTTNAAYQGVRGAVTQLCPTCAPVSVTN